MNNTTIVAGSVGAVAGGLVGFLVGSGIAKKESGLESLPELLGIFAAIGGGVLASALITPIAATTTPTSTTTVIPPPGA